MERDDHYYNSGNYRSDSYSRNSDGNAGRKLSNYQSRYENHGNYYGMPDTNHEYEDVRTTRGATFGNTSPGPMQRSSSNYDKYDRNNNRNDGNRSYNSGSSYDRQNSGNYQNRDNHYRYGDPNPYMGGYEQTRGTGWERDSSGAYRGNFSSDENSRYARQDNSYQSGGSGRRYSSYGRDEQRSYNPGGADFYNDRSDFNHSSSDNDFRGSGRSNKFYDDVSNRDEYQQGEIRDSHRNRDDNYATGLYASNRSYVSDQDYSKHENRYSRNSSDRRHRSGPDYNADSAASSYSKGGSLRG
ncbi:hypothetical protein I2I11_05525 [Pontibacter sp. 172403-2]|uniref:hypothetical protein n=1 Tax=Pontibacter rufus TaxID=2791028 RepID=UPI0018AFD147|nr:hypothetical protein [Pontibacter sp. 172403-2]MBF9252740.1 hypothetical protein [Pontibacter sp. 172403-2]